MEYVELSKENYKDYLPLDIVAFSFAFPGAMGDKGGVVIITTSGQLFYFNYVCEEFTDVEMDAILPILSQCELPIFGETELVPDGWRHISLGAGNNLLMQNQYVEPFFKMHEEYAQTVDEIDGSLYRSWLKIMMKVVNV